MRNLQFSENHRNKLPKTKRMAAGFTVAVSVIFVASMVGAFTSYTNSFNAEYGTAGTNGGTTMGSCITCHRGADGSGGLNPYGRDFNGSYTAIENIDSDGDGFTNIEEILVDAFPGDASSTPAPANNPPTANAGLDRTVDEGSTVTLDGSGSTDPDDGIASYQWQQTAGTTVTLLNPATVNPTFTAPDFVSGANTLTFQLTVTDSASQTHSDFVVITIANVNQPPVANAGVDQTILQVGVTVTLDGSNSSDPDDTIASYLWAQTAGTAVTLSDTTAVQPTFVSPNVAVGGESFTFSLTVTDGFGAQSTDYCIVTVSIDNLPPTANAGVDQTVNEGTPVTLDGSSSSDSDGTIASYLWTQAAGTTVTLSDPAVAQPTFTAPNVGTLGESLRFSLTVTDDNGLQASDEVIINVSWVNEPPNADAGLDQPVTEGETVILNGSGSSDPDGGPVTYSWTQTGTGPTITLSDPSAAMPKFVAPPVDINGTTLTFELTVEDAQGLQATDVVSITVSDNGITGFPADAITLNTTGGDPVGITVDNGGSITQLKAMDTTSLSGSSDMPQDFLMGLLDFQANADVTGGTITITVYLSQPAPDGHSWYKYNRNNGTWTDYGQETGINGVKGAVYNEARDQVTLTLVDGGMGDEDGLANGIIIDPSGPAAAVSTGGTGGGGTSGSNTFGTSGSGCFITVSSNNGSMPNPTISFIAAIFTGFLLTAGFVTIVRLIRKSPKSRH